MSKKCSIGVDGYNIALVLDSSKSMEDNDPENLRVEDSKLIVDEMKEDDRALVISFDKEARLLSQGLTNNKEEVHNALNSIELGAYTNLGAGLSLAIEKLVNDESKNQKVIIALTDGENNVENKEENPKINQDTYNQALQASNSNITIYTIGLGEGVDTELLKSIANNTGGKYFHVADNFGLKEVYRNVVEEMECLPIETAENENDKYVIFEDENLKKLVNELLGKAEDYNPTEKDLAEITAISSNSLDANTIQSLKGLEYAINLKNIDFSNQTINDLSPLYKLTNLEEIRINNNDLGLLNLLPNEDKKIYANYLADLINNSPTELTLIDGKVLDANKDGKVDLVLVFNQSNCLYPDDPYSCVYVKILTIDTSEVKVLFDTEISASSAQKNLLELSGSGTNSEIYIKNSKDSFELIIYLSGNVYHTFFEYYQYLKSNDKGKLSYSEMVKSVTECSAGDDDCYETYPTGQFTEIYKIKEDTDKSEQVITGGPGPHKIIKKDKDIQDILNIIKSSKIKISVETQSEFFNRLYKFATKKVAAKGGDYILQPEIRELFKDNGFVKSNVNYSDSFQEARGKIKESLTNSYGMGGTACYAYESFDMCTEDLLHEDISDIKGGIYSVGLSGGGKTVKDLEKALNKKINIYFAGDESEWGGYRYNYEFNGQQNYNFLFEDDSPNTIIQGVSISNINY